VSMILRGFVFVLAALGGVPAVYAQGSPATSLANQLDTCRQNVIQLTEQARVQQTKLGSLRAERKSLGSSGGEMARYKLANLDQELKEHSKQYQNANAQAEAEKKRCDALAAKMESASRSKR
jgi:seryl-tRNA synthetase